MMSKHLFVATKIGKTLIETQMWSLIFWSSQQQVFFGFYFFFCICFDIALFCTSLHCESGKMFSQGLFVTICLQNVCVVANGEKCHASSRIWPLKTKWSPTLFLKATLRSDLFKCHICTVGTWNLWFSSNGFKPQPENKNYPIFQSVSQISPLQLAHGMRSVFFGFKPPVRVAGFVCACHWLTSLPQCIDSYWTTKQLLWWFWIWFWQINRFKACWLKWQNCECENVKMLKNNCEKLYNIQRASNDSNGIQFKKYHIQLQC